MNLFQLIFLPLIGVFACRSIYRAIRAESRRKALWFSSLVWLTAGACVWHPDLMTAAAKFVGIGRGADLVLYVFCIVFLISAIYAYNRLQHMDAALTDVVRHLALRNASRATLDSSNLAMGGEELLPPHE